MISLNSNKLIYICQKSAYNAKQNIRNYDEPLRILMRHSRFFDIMNKMSNICFYFIYSKIRLFFAKN